MSSGKTIKIYHLIIVCLFLLEICSLFLTYQSYKNKNIFEQKEEHKVSDKKYAMYVEIENEDGTSNYEEYNDSNIFPTGYKINKDKTVCLDNKGNKVDNIVSGKYNRLTVTSNKTLYCYIYFDKHYTLSELCSSGDNLGSCLTTNNKEIDSLGDTAYSEMYRYTGTNEIVDDNYICFGTNDKDTCINNPETYMYRIIGVTSEANDTLGLETNQLKLIKHTSIGTHQWHSDSTTDTKWENSTMYTYLQNDVLNNTTYYPSGWSNKIDSVKWNIGDVQTYTDGNTIYNLESNLQTTNQAKLGLMYLSDYYYAYNSGGTINCGITECTNWLTDTSAETWTMSRYEYDSTYGAWLIDYDGDVYWGNYLPSTLTVHPVFYLNSDEQYISGDGTLDNPIILNYVEYKTVNIKSVMFILADSYDTAYIEIDGKIYKANTISSSDTDFKDVAMIEVPAGTTMTSYVGGTFYGIPPHIQVNGVVVADIMDGSTLKYDYIINDDIEVTLMGTPVTGSGGLSFRGIIRIQEQSLPSYNITLVPGDDTSGSGSGSVSLEQYTAKPGETVKIHISGSSSIYKGGIISYVLNGETVSYTYGDGIAVCQSQSKTESFIMPAADVTITYNGFHWSAGLC